MHAELIADRACQVGEGPLWHPLERRLYWLDIAWGQMFRFDPDSGHHDLVLEGHTVGGFTVQADGALLLLLDRGAIRLWRPGETTFTTVVADIPAERDTQFNDGIADPEGRVFAGTLGTASHEGTLYRLDTTGALTTVCSGVRGSNGLGFAPGARALYYTESDRGDIYRFDFDRRTGAVSNRTLFTHFDPGQGVPDGLTVDAEGCVWSALWDGGCVIRLDPRGHELLRVPLPARKVSSLAFGGPDLSDLYVTTAGGDRKGSEGPGAGALFCLRPGVVGQPDFLSRVRA